MKCAAYARSRVDPQEADQEKMQLDAQIHEIEEWAKERGYIIVGRYLDQGTSSIDYSRPAFTNIIQDALSQNTPFDAIVVTSLSRLFRDLLAYEKYAKRLAENKVKIIVLSSPFCGEDSKDLMQEFLTLYGKYERNLRSTAIRESMMENAKRGFYNGSTPPFGYKVISTSVSSKNGFKRKLIIEPSEAECVNRIFQFASTSANLDLKSVSTIAGQLNASGLRYRGKQWSKQLVTRILMSQIYCGHRILFQYDRIKRSVRPHNEWITVEMPVIITREVWNAIAVKFKVGKSG